jgi:hypothetical protein
MPKAAIVIVKDKLNCIYVHFRLIAISNIACKLGYGIYSMVCPKKQDVWPKSKIFKVNQCIFYKNISSIFETLYFLRLYSNKYGGFLSIFVF